MLMWRELLKARQFLAKLAEREGVEHYDPSLWREASGGAGRFLARRLCLISQILGKMVGVAGFEPATPSSRTR